MAVHEIKASWVHRLWGLGAPQTFPLGFIGMLHVLNSRGNGYLFLTEVFLFHSFPHFFFFIAHSEHVLSDHQANAGRTQTEHVWKRKIFLLGSTHVADMFLLKETRTRRPRGRRTTRGEGEVVSRGSAARPCCAGRRTTPREPPQGQRRDHGRTADRGLLQHPPGLSRKSALRSELYFNNRMSGGIKGAGSTVFLCRV